MIQRDNFDGIDNELYGILKDSFETLSTRMIYHRNNDLFHRMKKRIFGDDNLDTVIFCEFMRGGEKVTIKLTNEALDIKFDTFNVINDDIDTRIAPDEEIELYHYTYENTDGVPEVFEEGDFEYFSIKFHEIYSSIDIDEISLKTMN